MVEGWKFYNRSILHFAVVGNLHEEVALLMKFINERGWPINMDKSGILIFGPKELVKTTKDEVKDDPYLQVSCQ